LKRYQASQELEQTPIQRISPGLETKEKQGRCLFGLSTSDLASQSIYYFDGQVGREYQRRQRRSGSTFGYPNDQQEFAFWVMKHQISLRRWNSHTALSSSPRYRKKKPKRRICSYLTVSLVVLIAE